MHAWIEVHYTYYISVSMYYRISILIFPIPPSTPAQQKTNTEDLKTYPKSTKLLSHVFGLKKLDFLQISVKWDSIWPVFKNMLPGIAQMSSLPASKCRYTGQFFSIEILIFSSFGGFFLLNFEFEKYSNSKIDFSSFWQNLGFGGCFFPGKF